jgi:peptidyl-prolyl cis-trans isomerase D
MLTSLRRYLETWPVRIFFGIMVVAFVVWGVGDVVRQVGTTTYVAKVGGETIQPAQFQESFQRNMALMERQLPPGQDVTPALRRQVAGQTLGQMVSQIAIDQEIRRLRVVVPDAALRGAVFSMPAFQGANGEFDRAKLDAVLQANGLGEQQFLALMRQQLATQQVLSALTAGVTVPPPMAKSIFAFEEEKRSALMAELPVDAEANPPAPSDAELKNWYDNHPWAYQVPEYRRVQAAVLAPETLAKSLTVTDQELQAYYDSHKSEYVTLASRSLQVAVLHDEGKAKALAAQWHSGADWAAIQKQAQVDGGSAIELDKTSEAGVPDPDLAKAAFEAQPGSVAGPIKTALGWDVVKVTQATPGSAKSFAQVKDEIRARVLQQKASQQIYDVVNKVDDILGTGVGLTKIPSNLGVLGVEGTLDAQGNTPAGGPAPIPGPPELRKGLVDAAFKTPVGQPPAQLNEVQLPGQGGSVFYAVAVQSVTPAHEKPFNEVKDQVTADWTAAARWKEAEEAAAKMLTAIQGGQSLADAATVAGVTVRPTPMVTRTGSAEGMPAPLQKVLFSLKPGQPTMVESGDEFIVAVPDKTEVPKPEQDKAGFDSVVAALQRSLVTDVNAGFARALRDRLNSRVNQKVFESFASGS